MNQQRILDILWGGAVADAIGNPLEFKAEVTHADFLKAATSPVLRISDDTQMTLFALEAMLGDHGPRSALVRWYETQGYIRPRPYSEGLLRFQSLYAREAPGATCMRSCSAIAAGKEVQNDSKGNGTVMRAGAVAIFGLLRGFSRESVWDYARQDALLTHHHPFAWQSSVILCDILFSLIEGAELPLAILAAETIPGCEEVAAICSSMLGRRRFEAMRSRRCGWVAEEALALALGSALHADQDYLSIVKMACQGVSSDSDTVAGIAGQLSAAMGMPPSQRLRDRIVAKDALLHIQEALLR